jgi:hypothetical protein
LNALLLQIASDVTAQSDIIDRLESDRTALRMRVAALEAQLFESVGALVNGVAQHVSIVTVLACVVATLAALVLGWFRVSTPLSEPMTMATFVVGALSGACGMALPRFGK